VAIIHDASSSKLIILTAGKCVQCTHRRCVMNADFRGRKNNQPFYDCQG